MKSIFVFALFVTSAAWAGPSVSICDAPHNMNVDQCQSRAAVVLFDTGEFERTALQRPKDYLTLIENRDVTVIVRCYNHYVQIAGAGTYAGKADEVLAKLCKRF